jgi:adenylate kinase family enzyme
MRMVIVGNSGSGKTWLAARLADLHGIPVVHIDDIFWEPGGFDQRRPREVVLSMIQEAKAKDSWIAEGVFGELAEQFFDRAGSLVWLDIDWPTCQARLLKRGSESKKHMMRTQSEEGLKNLVEWASRYYERTNARSFAGHRKLMETFPGQKIHLTSEAEVIRMMELIQQSSAGDIVIHTSPKV